jgi:hypothetical protein
VLFGSIFGSNVREVFFPKIAFGKHMESKRTIMPDKNDRGAALSTSSDLPFEQRVDTSSPVDTESALKDAIRGTRDTPLPLKMAPAPPTVTIQVPPANSAATVDTPPGAGAGTAPREIRLETGEIRLGGHPPDVALTGAGNLAAYADVYRVASFRDNAERAEKLAGALATTIREEIRRLEDQRRNEPEWRGQIDFLRAVADTLDNIATAIAEARRAATPEEREQKLVEAERWAVSLAKAAKDFAERNYERIIDYGGYSLFAILGTQLFASMFGVPYEEALATQIALLGLSASKK